MDSLVGEEAWETLTRSADGSHGCPDGGGPTQPSANRTTEAFGAIHTTPNTGPVHTQHPTPIRRIDSRRLRISQRRRCYADMAQYWHPYASWFWRCRWFPWLPRWWWTGIHGPITPYMLPPAYTGITKEQEIAALEDQKKLLEEMLSQINKRLEELRKEEVS